MPEFYMPFVSLTQHICRYNKAEAKRKIVNKLVSTLYTLRHAYS